MPRSYYLPNESDGYFARGGRRYKGMLINDTGFWGVSCGGWWEDWSVINLTNLDSNTRWYFWQFIIDRWREQTSLILGDIVIEMADPGDSVFAGHPDFAAYTDGNHMWLNSDYCPGGPKFEELFFNDMLAHEFVHMFLAAADESVRPAICALFGKTMDDWDTGVWATSVKEAWCESWKDWALHRKHRKFDNRTNLRIPREKYFGPPQGTDDGRDFPGVSTWWNSEVAQVVWAHFGPSHGFTIARFEQLWMAYACIYGTGNLIHSSPHPMIYPYEKLIPDPILSQVSAGDGPQGMVRRGDA